MVYLRYELYTLYIAVDIYGVIGGYKEHLCNINPAGKPENTTNHKKYYQNRVGDYSLKGVGGTW